MWLEKRADGYSASFPRWIASHPTGQATDGIASPRWIASHPTGQASNGAGRSRNAKSGSMRKQEQLTFDFGDSSPEASRHNTVGGESGRINTVSNNYWSSTSNPNNTTNALNVNFNNGNVNNNNKTNNNYVRAVRGGKCQINLDHKIFQKVTSRGKPREVAKPISRSLSLYSLRRDIFSFENIY